MQQNDFMKALLPG